MSDPLDTPQPPADDEAAVLPNKLRLIRTARGLSLQDVADRMGTTNQQVSHLELGRRQLTQDWLERLGRALDTTANDILGGPAWTLTPASARNLERHWEPEEFVFEARVLNTPRDTGGETIEVLGQRFFAIPVYDADASAGPGSHVEIDTVRHHILFRTDWLRQVTLAPAARLMAVGIVGDSMEPTLRSGDTVLIDTLIQSPREDAIYVLRYDGVLQAKRLRVDPVNRLVSIISENPLYPPLINVNPADIHVAGRVIWIGRRV